ncbi:MAG TPA: GAP family protein [Solirubrobacterales bacterium]|nr:GAP family protein [Solirubrobacterales bacterium]
MAFASAIYPSLLAAVVLIMGQPNPRRLLASYMAGAMTMSVGTGLALVFGLSSSGIASGGDDRFGPGLDVAIGLIALASFWILLTERDRAMRERRERRRRSKPAIEQREPLSRRVLSRGSLSLTFALGVGLSLPGALYLVALKDIAEAEVGTGASVATIVAYNLIMFSLAEIPLLGYALAPDRTQAAIEGVNSWLGSHRRQVAMWLCAAAGVALLMRGLDGLLE